MADAERVQIANAPDGGTSRRVLTKSARGLCKTHYERWRMNPSDIPSEPKHESKYNFILRVVLAFEGDACLFWPYAKTELGRAKVWHQGKVKNAARLVCSLAHGDPSSPGLEAAHSCGNGHRGCVNPRHLRWATPEENEKDKALHGRTVRGSAARHAKLSEADVRRIRSDPRPAEVLAIECGVSPFTVRHARRRRTWKHVV